MLKHLMASDKFGLRFLTQPYQAIISPLISPRQVIYETAVEQDYAWAGFMAHFQLEEYSFIMRNGRTTLFIINILVCICIYLTLHIGHPINFILI